MIVFFDVVVVVGGGGENLVFGYVISVEGEGDVVIVVVVDGVVCDFGVVEVGGVFFEIVGEFGEEFVV